MMSVLFDRYRRVVPEDWVDYNGHLNEAYYLVAFSEASDAWMDAVGLDAAGRAALAHTIYTLEAHIAYLAETHAGATLRVTTQVLGVDAKRVYTFNRMHVGDAPKAIATHEALYVCVDTRTRRSAPWPGQVKARLDALCEAHAGTPAPEAAGRSLGLHRLKPA